MTTNGKGAPITGTPQKKEKLCNHSDECKVTENQRDAQTNCNIFAPTADAKIKDIISSASVASDRPVAATRAASEIVGEMERAKQREARRKPRPKVIHKTRTYNDMLRYAMTLPPLESLWHDMIFRGDVACIFADSGQGKSILATQIGADIASSGKSVINFDFEMRLEALVKRYSDAMGAPCVLPDTYYHTDMEAITNQDNIGLPVLERIRQEVIKTETDNDIKVDVVIIDNMMTCCAELEKGEEAQYFVMSLKDLRDELDVTIILVAHTPKRFLSTTITQNDLAGSKKIYNLLDSVVAIGRSATDTKTRYIKQLKNRVGMEIHGIDNVIKCHIDNDGGMLKFVEDGTCNEQELLRSLNETNDEAVKAQCVELKKAGKTIDEIAAATGFSRTKVGTITKGIKHSV